MHRRERRSHRVAPGLGGHLQRGQAAVHVERSVQAAGRVVVAGQRRERRVPGVVVVAAQVRLPIPPRQVAHPLERLRLHRCERAHDGLAVDEIRANTLEIVDGHLTGRVLGEIVGPREKARHLAEIAAVHDVPAQRTIAVGDGANDALMLEAAAVGVAFCAKPALREHADLVVDERDLRVVWDRARGLLD